MRKQAQMSDVTCPKSHSWEVALGFNSRHYDSRALLINPYTTVPL